METNQVYSMPYSNFPKLLSHLLISVPIPPHSQTQENANRVLIYLSLYSFTLGVFCFPLRVIPSFAVWQSDSILLIVRVVAFFRL